MKTILSANQSKILQTLLPVAEIALDNAKNNEGPLKPRMHTLICAPSGTGKSHLMKELGKQTKAEVLHINVSSWIPIGANKDANNTFRTIIDFIDNNPKGIIIMDELDKIDGSNDWAGYVRLEIHDLLDGVIPPAVKIPEDSNDDDDIW